MASVLTLGIAVYDIVLGVEAMPVGDTKCYARTRQEVIGGIAANAAITVQRLGGRAVIATRLGQDFAGEHLAQTLGAFGVDTRAIEWVNGAKTPISAILVDRAGHRLLINHTEPGHFKGPAPDLDAMALEVEAVMTDTRWMPGALAALAWAEARDLPRVVDFDRMPAADAEALLARASHVAFGEQGLSGLTGSDDPETGLRRASALTPGWVAVTAGRRGVYWLEEGHVRHSPPFEVEAVDTLAAGDVFHGALALALAERQPIEVALRFAQGAAAIKCMHFGGGAGIPTRAELLRFLEERP